ncbi:MAG: hypothetical protein C4547_05110 [Phycisphaerales bacterium]|nr:MAG: hypothetical protein C4547_05110 [Phycisphaerales bacterium]
MSELIRWIGGQPDYIARLGELPAKLRNADILEYADVDRLIVWGERHNVKRGSSRVRPLGSWKPMADILKEDAQSDRPDDQRLHITLTEFGIALLARVRLGQLSADTATRNSGAGVAGNVGKFDGLTGEAKALGVLATHPEWPNTRIAEVVGCNVRTLYKWERFTAARAVYKEAAKRARGTAGSTYRQGRTGRVRRCGG